MAQEYKGYFQPDGRFIVDNSEVRIPTMRRVVINVLDDEIVETKAQKQRRAFEKFAQIISDAEPLGEEFDQVMRQGVHVRGELNL